MGRVRHAVSAVVALIWGWLGVAGAVGAAPALWRVEGPHTQIYLFGTLHALEPQAHWRTAAYDAAYRQARVVWFETALDDADPQAVQGMVQRYGVDADHPLSGKLAPRDLARLARQVDVARVDHMRPWAVALMLSMQPVLARGASVETGADLTMTRAARHEAKEVRTFETLEQQVQIFAGLSEPTEVRYLSEVIHEHAGQSRPSLGASPEGLERAWLSGDLARLGAGLVGGMKADNPGLYEALLKRRNEAWAQALSQEMASADGVELVNVGALHMVGDDGLPALMRARGYRVVRVQ